ncbi:RDD family protein [bacterium]|nr:RDD family protein [bacterium]
MPQVAPYLKPDGKRGPAKSDKPDRDALNMPKLPVAGFLRRFGALLFDLIFLYTVLRILTSAMPGPFFALGDWAPKVGSLIFIAYFTIGNGPFGAKFFGKGRTLGKFLTGIRVTDYAGNPPSLPQSFLRTLLLFPLLVTSYWIAPLLLDEGSFIHNKIGEVFGGYLLISLFFATLLTIIFNPFKQGLHDYFVRTLVRPAAAPAPTFSELTETIGQGWKKYQMQPVISGIVTLVLIWGAFLVLTWPGRTPAERIARYEREYLLPQEAGLPELKMSGVGIAPPEGEPMDPEVIQALRADLMDEASSSTLAIGINLIRQGEGPLTEAERLKAEGLARTYYDEILRTHTFAEIFPYLLGSDDPNKPPRFQLTNSRERPIRLRLFIMQEINLIFPYQHRKADEVAVDFPPLGKVVAQ